ncbi:uncharacterized protein LOC133628652 isoform X2 [Colius striatus]|uniref:uncharacterized protein LOC133628652 isoform X2 n=1 Tax=Colius striatus TaxID=57412 RepID=UPI002B1DC802|nr:uncharacterized protein LOC133628652 isoform X2 [Colius striatus]XP_061873045.1 uncharacterized protein LOC133628652 isoform X2 [Colius striatus]XP_061873047.1 uncharacterized protein LOC133628652 isoform X2 [Colius striatus]XP_061873048.1 uncharacterized protein LOC133628652 isoform X2 [Colius striatus]
MNRLATANSDLIRLQQPLQYSLSALGTKKWLLSKGSPRWEKVERHYHDWVTNTVGTVQDNVSLALSCVQTQLWMQSVAALIIREGGKVIFPTEIQKVVWNSATNLEKELQSWWTLVNFTYDPITDTATAFVLTVCNASIYVIHPIIALGLNHNRTVLCPSEHRTWTQMVHGKWQTVNLEPCITRKQQGLICKNSTLDAQDICLNTEQSICHFEIHPDANQKTVLVYIGQGCVCLRTACTSIVVDKIIMDSKNNSNFCICNFVKIVGCDFSYLAPTVSDQLIKSNYTTLPKSSPVPIGMNLTLVTQLKKHQNLIKILNEVQENGKKTPITVHYDTRGIKRVLK